MRLPFLAVAEVVGFAAASALLVRLPPLTGDRLRRCVAAVAVASAAGAVVAGGAATGWTPLDAVLRAALGAGVVVAASRAGSVPALIAAAIALAGSWGSDVMPVAALATGVALAPAMTRRTHVFVDLVTAALVVQVVLRLDHATRGVSALLAVAALAPLVVAGGRRLEPPLRRTLVRVAAGVGAFMVLGTVLGAAAALLARPSLQQGVDVLAGGGVTRVGLEATTTEDRLDTALRSFTDARATLDAWWARPAAAVPVVSQHLRLLRTVAASGQELSASGVRAVAGGGIAGLTITNGRIPLERIPALAPVLDDTVRQLAVAHRRLDAARSTWLLPPLGHRVDKERAKLDAAESAARGLARALPELPALLGANEPRRYFLAVQTPAEARAGGGYMGNYGEITADNGQLELSKFGRIFQLEDQLKAKAIDLQAPPDYLARYARFDPTHVWSAINVSPDFPTVAAVIGALYPEAGGQPIDGVIAVDPSALAGLLTLVGPVSVEGWPEPITAANAEQILYFDQYVGLDYFDRVDFLGEVARQVWGRLTTGSLPSPQELLPALGPAVRGKHLLMTATRPAESRLLDEAGVSGRMAPVDGDFLGVVTQNAGGNKIDAFLHRQVDYDVRLDPGTGQLTGTAKVVLRNDAPASGLPGPVIGNLFDLPSGTNKLYLSVYTPWALAGATVDGHPVVLEAQDELGRRVYSTGLVIPPGSSTTVVLRLSGQLPPGVKGYRLDVHRQTTVVPEDVRTSLTVPSGWRIGDGGTKWAKGGDLDANRTVELAVGKSGPFG
ncbi:MAG: hypothetical protein QOE93_2309 [Actinomycetota bacterium]|nr:hypothetical protein [Actinomycetota bacterium]